MLPNAEGIARNTVHPPLRFLFFTAEVKEVFAE